MDDFEKELCLGFLEEAGELLQNSEKCFLALESAKDDPTIIEQIFRLAHNLKGSAGAVGFTELKDFTHILESLLLRIKNKELNIDSKVINLLLGCNDHLSETITKLKENLDAHCDNPQLVSQMQVLLDENYSADDFQQANEPSKEEVSPAYLPEEAHALAPANAEPVQSIAKKTGPVKASPDENIRVSLNKIDSLLNNVGELVIMQTVLAQQKNQLQSTLLQKTISQMAKIVKEIQGTAMGLRMLPIKQTFQKMQRIVRDTSADLGKEISFELYGEETEFDKTVIEQLGDPLVHLVRNAVDHGIETPEERLASGKPEEGSIKLSAYHRGDKIVIEIQDDGKGLDPARLKAKGVEKGLIKSVDSISDEEAYQLIFAPGFSTKTKITDVSGRGVGMDVVKTNINQLQGDIKLESEIGKGTCFKIFLPLTLAIVDSMIVSLNDDRFVVPITQISESLRPKREDLHYVNERDEVLVLRGETIPLYRLGNLLNRGDRSEKEAWDSIVLVVRDSGTKPFSILVDDIICQQQVVVKRLGEELQGLPGVSGAAILGDGKANLILDLFELINTRIKPLQRPGGRKTKEVA